MKKKPSTQKSDTRKIVINSCYGGYSLSAKAVKRLAELQGRKCYFFKHEYKNGKETHLPVKGLPTGMFWTAYDIPDPYKRSPIKGKDWMKHTEKERIAANKFWESHIIDNRPWDRADPLLIQVVEELGSEANGDCAKLTIVEIPSDVEWEIEEYDGNEHISEAHRTWR